MSNSMHATKLALALLLTSSAWAHDGDPKLRDRQPMYAGPGYKSADRVGPDGNLTSFGPGITFPASGVTLLSWLSLPDFGVPGGGNGNSCFGYTAPSGREYAIMGLSTGTAFVEITQPSSPVIVAQIAGPNSLWRDMKVYQNYAYAVSEGGGGIQVMDMSQIDSGIVTLVNTIMTGPSPAATHTLALNTDSGYLYRAGGGSNGLRIYDLNPDPSTPVYVASWSDRYTHEAQIVSYTSGPLAGKEIAISCGGFNTGFDQTGIDVIDVTNKAAITLLDPNRVFYANAEYSHQAWLSPDRQYLYLNDELDDQNLGITSLTRVFNASDMTNMTLAGTFTNGNTSIDHNLYTKGTTIFESNYRSGLRIFDATNPVAPVEVGYFDTYPEDNAASFNGLWNNYPYFPSGIVIGSDIEKGLFVWWIGSPLIAFALPDGEPNSISPAGDALAVEVTELSPGALVPGTAKLHYDVGAGYVVTDLVPNGGNDYTALFPSAPCGTVVSYYFTGESTNGIVWSDPQGAPNSVHTTTVAFGFTPIFADSFETNLGWTGTTAGDTASTGLWTRVNPNGTLAQPEDDHTTNPAVLCWVTGQGTVGGAVGEADVDGGRTTLTSPIQNLTGMVSPTVSYWRWYSNNQGGDPNNDTFRVDITNNNGTNWVNVETVGPAGVEAGGGWFFHQFQVADFVTPTAQVRLRFIAEDAGTGSVVEAAVDDFQVTDLVCTGFQSYCAGDDLDPQVTTDCPCANFGDPGHGCANSNALLGGAELTASGTVLPNTIVLDCSGIPNNNLCTYLRGTASAPTGSVFGDGVKCVEGTLVRFGAQTSGQGGNLPNSVSAAPITVAPGNTRYYQLQYRNAAPTHCPPGTFNASNGVIIVW